MKTAVLIGAGPRGRLAYLEFLEKNDIKLIGVADPIKSNRDWVQEHYGVADDMCFENYADMEPLGKIADIALICTNDRDHLAPFRMCSKQGYHILLEKPISPFPEEVAEVDNVADNYDKTLMICHVLRYTPFFMKIKEIIESGRIGKIMSINHNENMAYWFAVNSFVRGKWRNDNTTSPIILAKCCHDMDILTFLTGKKCLRVSSFGNTGFFNEANAPEGSGTRCVVDCKIADECPYNPVKFNINPPPNIAKFRVPGYIEDEESLKEDLRTSDWGKCVFRCDNNVCDHQVLAMEFEDNITVVFTVSSFTYDHSRTIKVMGTYGEIGGDLDSGEIELKIFGARETEKFKIEHDILKHGGGDEGLINAFARCVDGDASANKSPAKECLHSHMIAFAAEEARKTGKVVNVEEFTQKYKQRTL